jgi:hypothetical protein
MLFSNIEMLLNILCIKLIGKVAKFMPEELKLMHYSDFMVLISESSLTC